MSPTKEEADEVLRVTKLMEQMNKNLEGIGDMRKRFNEVLEAVDSRMKTLEIKIDNLGTEGIALGTADQEDRFKTIEKELEMTQVAMEKLETKGHIHKDLQESIENTVNYTEETEKLAKEDNKFMEGMYTEMKEHITNTEEKLKEFNKLIAKNSTENEKTNKFRLALKNFLNVVLEEG